jgi:hypothetical protein
MPTALARPTRTLIGLLLLTGLTGLLLAAGSGTARAADGYKYWNYFHVQKGAFAFARTGPADYTPKEGSVDAYRYGLSSTAAGLTPRTGASTYSFQDLCADAKSTGGQKRVGVLIDYGTAKDAESGQTPPKPRGACAVVPTGANGQQVIDAVADVRVEKSLLCGIDGYPASGCSVTVKNPPKAAAEQRVGFTLPAAAKSTGDSAKPAAAQSEDDDFPWTLVVVVVVVVVLAGAGLMLARRSSRA